jgi:hypothetical protein
VNVADEPKDVAAAENEGMRERRNSPASFGTAHQPISLLRQAPVLILFAAMVADSARYADYDLWGHIAFGNQILHRGHVVLYDSYSYSVPGRPYLNHEWLAQVIIAASYDTLGVRGLKLLKFLCTSATVVFMAMAQAETGAPLLLQLGTLTAASIVLIVQMQFRPQLFTFVLLSVLLWILARENYRRRAPLWLGVPMMALWVSLHGGFIIGLVAMGVYGTVAGLQDLLDGKGWRRGLILGANTLAMTAATLLMPNGIPAWRMVVRTLSRPGILQGIVEWQPLTEALRNNWGIPHSGEIFFLLFTIMIAVTAISFILRPRGGDLPMVAVAGVIGISPFLSIRNMALAVIATALPMTRHLQLLFQGFRQRGEIAHAQPGVRFLCRNGQIVIAALALILGIRMGLFSTQLPDYQPMPAGALAFMDEHSLHGNVLCDLDWGEYLIFHGAPRIKVFIDGRYQALYPPQVMRAYLFFAAGVPRSSRLLDEYPHDFVLIRTGSSSYAMLMKREDWKLIYHDPGAALFARSSAPAARLSGVSISETNASRYFP